MTRAADIRCRHNAVQLSARSAASRIAAFLNGETSGEELLHALYDHILNEPIPPALRTILSEAQTQAQ